MSASDLNPAAAKTSTTGPGRATTWTVLTALVVTFFAAAHAWQKGPYSQHVDEHHLLGASHAILQSGNFDPDWYRYGSVSIHLCVLGEAIGYLDDARKSAWKPVANLPKSVVPLMRPSRLGSWPRLLFALTGGVAALLAGLCANRLRPGSWAGPLAILLLVGHPTLREQWYGYLNVNIVAVCFALAAIWVHLSAPRGASWWRSSALAAAFWGLAAAAKYPVGVGVVAVVLTDVWAHRQTPERACLHALAAPVVALAAFLLAMPFALTNMPGFLSDLAFELSHYAKGHRDFTSEPGLESAWHHLQAWLLPLGPAAAASVLGAFVCSWSSPRRAAAVLGPSALLLGLLALQATNFVRNSLLFGYVLSILAAVGIVALHPWLLAHLRRMRAPFLRSPWLAGHGAPLALILLTVALAPHARDYVELARRHQESRDALELQLLQLPEGTVVAIPHPDFMATTSAAKLVPYDPTKAPAAALAELERSGATYAVVPRKWARSRFRGESSVRTALTHAQALTLPGRSVWHAGSDEVWVHWPFHPRGNPAIDLVALDRPRLLPRPPQPPPTSTSER